MIDYIQGILAEVTPAYVVIDCHGIGYEINISLIDYAELQSCKEIKLFIQESIREDAHILYGFISKRSRALFRLLTGVSGVGPNTARLILSAMPVEQLEQAIAAGDDKILKTVKGIGGKTAQRIIVDLKDKIAADSSLSLASSFESNSFEDALAALTTLGFTTQLAQKVLRKVYKDNTSISTEEAIRKALSMM